ncbi:hypothetical protein JKF63_00672 [Porcisia hertigi]|uniref:Uncharacterized protein n=1 Tax=Porcisia hertigi TaxID=2761500 RepID=A0A836KYJ5_9TRYP|nr:hypothetical protein JKF63_00672 [Porcisia hertigi]
MRRPEPWQRLLSHVIHTVATPFILRIGLGPPGSASQLSAPPHRPSYLPIFAANYCELSAFEKDFAVRCLEYVAHQKDDAHGEERGAKPQVTPSSAPSPTVCTDEYPETWRPLFDLVVLPNGTLCIGWFRHHALDLQWGHHVEAYVADLWQRAPRTLWLHSQEKLSLLVRRQLPMRHRHLAVFHRQDTVTPAETAQCLQAAARSLLAATSTTHRLEHDVLLRVSNSGGPTLPLVRVLIRSLERRNRPLPTGTAIALMRLLVSTSAMCFDNMPRSLAEAILAAARRICDLASDSGCRRLLVWGALLVGSTDEQATTPIEVAQEDAATQALTLTLLSVIDMPGNRREAALRWQAEQHLCPLCDALVSEEAMLLDALTVFGSDANNAEDRAALSYGVSVGDGPFDADAASSSTVQRDIPALYFRCALGETMSPGEDKASLYGEPAEGSGVPPIPWLPGTGSDAKGCWCTLLTHSRILLSHSKAEHHHPQNKIVSSHAAMVERVQSMLRVSLVRRCLFATTKTNICSQYSIITHLFSSGEEPLVCMTLIRLADTDVVLDVMNPHVHLRALMGLLFLFPALEMRSLYGGTVACARESLSAGTCALQCSSSLDLSHAPAAPNTSVSVRIPPECAEGLSTRLLGRDSALICLMHRAWGEPTAAFLLDDLRANLHTILCRPPAPDACTLSTDALP